MTLEVPILITFIFGFCSNFAKDIGIIPNSSCSIVYFLIFNTSLMYFFNSLTYVSCLSVVGLNSVYSTKASVEEDGKTYINVAPFSCDILKSISQ